MGAGDGAAEQSRLAAERVARLKRRLDEAERGTKPWDADAVDESVVADKLSELIPLGWHVLHDVYWPGRPKANLDHVLVGPGGVVVVNAKNWTGEVRVASGVLWQGRYARTQAVEGALAQCAAVASVVAPPHRRLVRPLICMAAQPDLFGVTSSDVAVAGSQRVVGAIEALPPVLDKQAVAGLYAHLGQELTHEQQPGIMAFRQVRPGTMVPPAEPPKHSAKAAGRTGSSSSLPVVRGHLSAAGPKDGQGSVGQGSMGHGSVGHSSAGGHPLPRVRQHASAGAGRLALLAAFVIFALYVLPYWGQ